MKKQSCGQEPCALVMQSSFLHVYTHVYMHVLYVCVHAYMCPCVPMHVCLCVYACTCPAGVNVLHHFSTLLSGRLSLTSPSPVRLASDPPGSAFCPFGLTRQALQPRVAFYVGAGGELSRHVCTASHRATPCSSFIRDFSICLFMCLHMMCKGWVCPQCMCGGQRSTFSPSAFM